MVDRRGFLAAVGALGVAAAAAPFVLGGPKRLSYHQLLEYFGDRVDLEKTHEGNTEDTVIIVPDIHSQKYGEAANKFFEEVVDDVQLDRILLEGYSGQVTPEAIQRSTEGRSLAERELESAANRYDRLKAMKGQGINVDVYLYDAARSMVFSEGLSIQSEFNGTHNISAPGRQYGETFLKRGFRVHGWERSSDFYRKAVHGSNTLTLEGNLGLTERMLGYVKVDELNAEQTDIYWEMKRWIDSNKEEIMQRAREIVVEYGSEEKMREYFFQERNKDISRASRGAGTSLTIAGLAHIDDSYSLLEERTANSVVTLKPIIPWELAL